MAHIAAHDIGLGRTSIICALLHDVVEDTKYTLDDIREMFGEKVERVVDGLTKFEQMDNVESLQAENFKKIISSMSYDIRVVLIKLSDRLHNMRTLDSMPKHKQLKIASETSYLYAPLAYRLGLHAIKIELDDLALKYTNPTIYANIKKRVDEVREKRMGELHAFIDPLNKAFANAGMTVRCEIKERSVNSIWKRMMDKELAFEDLYGSFIVRLVTDCPKEQERMECWKIYAVLTDCYRPYTRKLKDWISFPKANGYESLHAVVMGPTGNWVEVQIRSQRMEEIAEKGFAAYWKYKTDNDKTESGFDEWLKKAQDLINNKADNAIEFVDNFKLDLFSDEIYVFTPQGKMITLPKGSTVLDFAYNIHSEIGDHSIAANVNNQLSQLDRKLYKGDQVEIITSEAQHPQEKWFEFLATATAKSRLKSGIKEYRRTFRDEGEKKYEEIMRKLDLDPSKANRSTVMTSEGLTSSIDFYYQVATGKIDERLIRSVLKPQSGSSSFVRYLTFGLLGNGSKEKDQTPAITSSGEFDFNVSTCCNPIPGDDVIAFNFPGEPLQIHRSNCPRAIQLSSRYGNNIVKAKWQPKSEIAFLAELKITALDSAGLLNRMTNLLSNEMQLNLHMLHMEAKQDVVEAIISIYVHNTKELDDLMTKLNQLKEIQKVVRKNASDAK